ncbi:MAG TPA: gamma carbonic anhydrase family protein [Steroidobacteraceae bacterium]|jgi:carbonic anhydrase/acetyltransferase-like protein (isoleucine patch superfamily)|nr:gamma carbonic anhydrase family protein [Steroidobacteraceae bacterium]
MIYTLGDRRIETASEDYYVAPDASVIGTVRFGVGASVWFNCVLRGDSDWIELGDGVNVQDGTIMHTDEGEPLTLGRRVSVGHRAMLHGCSVGESTLIASGAMVLDRARIGAHCIIAAGTLVPPGKIIPDGSVVMGSPGQIVRKVNDRDRQMIESIAQHYIERIRQYQRELGVDERSTQ